MRRNDRTILIALPLVALAAAFWFLLISPKRDEASRLGEEIDSTAAALENAESQIALAEEARQSFPRNYGELVKLGRAVPEDDDQSTLVYDMAEMGKGNKLDFRSFVVIPGSGDPVPAATPPPSPSDSGGGADGADADASTVSAPAPATEASAALLPIGATVGPAGLPVTPYEFTYTGSFFHVADFLRDLDATVTTRSGKPVVHGRLMTVDGFSLIGDQRRGFPKVEANFAVTTYVVPPGEGVTGGATPAGPAPATDAGPTPVSASADPTPAPAAAATP